MGINFNIVKKPKAQEDDGEELEEEVQEESKPSSSGYDPKKKMLRFMAIIICVVFVLLIILFVVSSLGGSKESTYSYSEIENILEKAGKSYFKDHPDYLPSEEGDVIEVDSSTLVEAEVMKDLSSYPTKDNVVCTGSVKVEYDGDDYLYNPILNCGSKYSTVSLNSKILDNSEIVTTGDGLYVRGGEYVFRGENVNNYIELDEILWRIVKITANDEFVLISEDSVGRTISWDDRYNEQKNYAAGINSYSVSRIKDYLDAIYKDPNENIRELILSKKDKSKLVAYNVCIGKKAVDSQDKSNADECKEVLRSQKVGLLTLSDYLYASVDPNCKSSESKSCANYNYLVTRYNWWLATANSANTYSVYKVRNGGSVSADSAANFAIARPVIHLNGDILYKSGNGTAEKPYKVR